MKLAKRREPAAADVFAAPGWWSLSDRTYASLRAVNLVRLQYLFEWQRDWFGGNEPKTVIDFGCGGGLMAVPIARRGAKVVAVDRCRPALREGAAQAVSGVHFVCGDLATSPVREGCADLVLLNDVLEHVDDPAAIVAMAGRALRPGGAMFVNTINRTFRARLLAVWVAEGIGMIPRGTHSADQFITPSELVAAARAVSLRKTHEGGESPRLWASLRTGVVALRRSRSKAVGYCMGFQKEIA